MNYYRKAVAVFILVMTLASPLLVAQENKVALVEIKAVTAQSKTLNSIKKNKTEAEAEAAIMEIIKKEAALYAKKHNYSSVITKHLVYRGGEDISSALAKKIDKEN
ncbi:MAG: hypothetical protein ACQER0_02060 [Bacillota bacterium]